MPKLGKIICATFFVKSLDKMAGWWYNGISGAGNRQRAAKKSIGKNTQKLRWLDHLNRHIYRLNSGIVVNVGLVYTRIQTYA